MLSVVKFLTIFLIIGFTKYPLGFPILGHYFLIPLGLFLFFHFKFSIAVDYKIPLLILPILILGGVFESGVVESFLRVFQLLSLIVISSYISRMRDRELDSVLSVLSGYVIVFTFVEIIYSIIFGASNSRTVDSFGFDLGIAIDIPRLEGLYGASNFSSLFAGLLSLYMFLTKRFYFAIGMFFVAMLTMSRGFMLAYFAAIFVWGVGFKFGFKYCFLTVFPIVLLIVLYPVFVLLMNRFLDPDSIDLLIYLSTTRFMHQVVFSEMGMSNPIWGVGYGNGIDRYDEYAPLVNSGSFDYTILTRNHEAHNLLLDVMGELGVIAYVLLAVFILKVLFVCRRSVQSMAIIGYIMIGYVFLSGVTDMTFWLALGLALKFHFKKEKES